MLRNFFLILFLLIQTLALAQNRKALVVGIGEYQDPQWHRISGDRDVDLVRRYLGINGFKDADIRELTNSDATFRNIRKEFLELAKSAKPGDIVYIHFSAHGQQVTDLDGDEPDGYDEAIVPYDAFKEYRKGVYEGEHHITDDTLFCWLSVLKDRIGESGKIVVVSDACHSGDGSRDDDGELTVRGTSGKFIIPGSASMVPSETNKKLRWTYISACKSYQSNYEYIERESGNSFGRLTYMIHKMHGLGKALSEIPAGEYGKQLRLLFGDVCEIPQTPGVESFRMDLPVF